MIAVMKANNEYESTPSRLVNSAKVKNGTIYCVICTTISATEFLKNPMLNNFFLSLVNLFRINHT